MKITIHRGINQIGGCATEIQSGEDRIMIDLGGNLPGTEGKDFTMSARWMLLSRRERCFAGQMSTWPLKGN